MSWQDQGRQYHMWFGHGTAAASMKQGGGSTPLFRPGSFRDRLNAAAYAAAMHMPRQVRNHPNFTFDSTRLDHLRRAATAWIGARSLPDAAFSGTLLDRRISQTATTALRVAAQSALTAQNHGDLREVSRHLAVGMQSVGPDMWPATLADAATRADAYTPPAGNTVYAQLSTNIASDAAASASSSGPATNGAYVASDPGRWAGMPSVGTGECVPLVQQATGAPRSTLWQKGEEVEGNTAIPPGTAIATFGPDGHYKGHAAIYQGQNAKGIQVTDQWNNRNSRTGQIMSKQPPHDRTIRFNNPKGSIVDQGEKFYVVR